MAEGKLKIRVEVEGKSIDQLKAELKTLQADLHKNQLVGSAGFTEGKAKVDAMRAAVKQLTQATVAQVTANKGLHETYFKIGTALRNVYMFAIKAFAAFYALKQAADLMENAAQIESNFAALDAQVRKFGTTAEQVLADVKKAGQGILDDDDIVAVSTRAVALGIPVDKLGTLMKIAQAKARDMGITTKDAFEKITQGAALGRSRMLAQVGILVKAKDAAAEYAEEMGVAEKSIGTAEQRAAMLAEVIELGTQAVKRYNLEELTRYEQIQKLKASIDDLKNSAGAALWRVSAFVIGVYESLTFIISAGMTALLVPFALVETALNKLGITSGKTLQYMVADGIKQSTAALKEMHAQWKLMTADSGLIMAALNQGTTAVASTLKQRKTLGQKAGGMEEPGAGAMGRAEAARQRGADRAAQAKGEPKSFKQAEIAATSLQATMKDSFTAATGYLAEGFADAFATGNDLLDRFLGTLSAGLMNAVSSELFTKLLSFLPGGGILGFLGLQHGGLIQEPVIGRGLRSGSIYTLAEAGPEYVTPSHSQAIAMGSMSRQMSSLTDAVAGGVWRMKGNDMVYTYDRNKKIMSKRQF